MIIKSRFKDYYDRVVKKYGVDENIVFCRDELSPISHSNVTCDNLPRSIYNGNYASTIFFYWLVVCAKQFLLIDMPNEPQRLITKEDLENPNIFHEVNEILPIRMYSRFKKSKGTDDIFKILIGKENSTFIPIHRKINSPIFKIVQRHYNKAIVIDSRSPKLKDIKGIPSILPAEELYKDIVYFIGNKINNGNPDESKSSSISNNDKIVKGGFDPIVSFRKQKSNKR